MPRVPPEIDLSGISIRRYRIADLDEQLAAISASQAELGQWLAFANGLTREAQAAFLAQAVTDFDAQRDYAYAVLDRDGCIAGGAALHPMGSGRAGIGYWAASDHTGGGQTTAVAESLTSVAFSCLGAEVVEIQCDAANHGSAAIPARLGYRLAAGRSREIVAPGHTGWGLIWEMGEGDWGQERSETRFRTAREEDRPAVAAGLVGAAGYFDDRLADGPAAQLLLAEEAGVVVGWACLRWEDTAKSAVAERLAGIPQLDNLEVAPSARRRGVGAGLTLFAESQAKAGGADRLWLGVEPDDDGARRLYERLGYFDWGHGPVSAGWTYTLEGMDHKYQTTIQVLVKTLRRRG